MKRFFIRLGIYVMIIIACDFVVGFVGDNLLESAKGGNTKRKYYMANNINEELLIFGSSRAFYHYDPEIIQDSLCLSAYNCGFEESGIICAYGYLKMILQRYHPRIVIYDIMPFYDLIVNDNFYGLSNLPFFYEKQGIDSIFWSVRKSERYKMISKMYRYNYVYPEILLDNIYPIIDFKKGHRTLNKDMVSGENQITIQETCEYDSLRLYYLEKLIRDCKNKTQLVFTVSPVYGNTVDSVLLPIKTLCNKYGIPILNHYTDSTFNNRSECFADKFHLNNFGATEYSKVVAREIKQIIK